MNHETEQTTAHVEQITFSWLNKHFDNLWLAKLYSIIEAKHSILIHRFLLFKMLVADLRNNKPIGNNLVNRKDHLMKSYEDTTFFLKIIFPMGFFFFFFF